MYHWPTQTDAGEDTEYKHFTANLLNTQQTEYKHFIANLLNTQQTI